MYPEDRVLIGIMPDPRDLLIAREQHWYRIPLKQMPKGIHAEYMAFYFPKKFPKALRWGIHFYARRFGHELARRVDLFPEQADHKRAEKMYFKVQLGPLKPKSPPIVSEKWRRITFIHTTWDRFVAARTVSDLYSTDDRFVDRVHHALKVRGLQPERDAEVLQGQEPHTVDLLIPCKNGAVMFTREAEHMPDGACVLTGDVDADLESIQRQIVRHGGPLMIDLPL